MIKQQFDELTSDIEQISENVCACINIYIEFFCINMGKLSIRFGRYENKIRKTRNRSKGSSTSTSYN